MYGAIHVPVTRVGMQNGLANASSDVRSFAAYRNRHLVFGPAQILRLLNCNYNAGFYKAAIKESTE